MKLPVTCPAVVRATPHGRFTSSYPRSVVPQTFGGGGGGSQNACQQKYGNLASQCPDGTCCPFGYYCVYNPAYNGYYCSSGGGVGIGSVPLHF